MLGRTQTNPVTMGVQVDSCLALLRHCTRIRSIRRSVGRSLRHGSCEPPRAAGPVREPLWTAVDGTILDGHARWQVAIGRKQSHVPCIEYDVIGDDALRIVIQRHQTSEGLNAYGRVVLALGLESDLRARRQVPTPASGYPRPSSNFTNQARRDVRKDLAAVAGVSTGNVSKVKQLLDRVIPDIRSRLLRGEVSIHQAWQWRLLSSREQRDALWEHLHRGAIKKTIGRLIKAHTGGGRPAQPTEVASTVLDRLARCRSTDLIVAVADVPGRALVVTRTFYDELLGK